MASQLSWGSILKKAAPYPLKMLLILCGSQKAKPSVFYCTQW